MKTSNHLLRRLTAALLAAVLALSIALPVFASDDGDTIYINSVSDLLSLAKSCAYDQWSVGKTVILQKDLSLEGMLWEPIPSFSGQFKGNGHTISDLTITGQYSPAGLFGIVEEQGSIESLSVRGIVSVSDSADTTTGGIVGINHGTLINCQFTGVVTGDSEVGGIVGRTDGLVSGCVNQGHVLGRKDVGGIAGQAAPYRELALSKDTIKRLRSELDVLRGLVDDTTGVVENSTTSISNSFSAMTSQMDTAIAAARQLDDQASDYGDEVADEIDRASTLLADTLTKLEPVMDTGEDAMTKLTDATGNLKWAMREMAAEMLMASSALSKTSDGLGKVSDAAEDGRDGMSAISEGIKQLLESVDTGDDSAASQAISGILSAYDSLSSDKKSDKNLKTGIELLKVANSVASVFTLGSGMAPAMKAVTAGMGLLRTASLLSNDSDIARATSQIASAIGTISTIATQMGGIVGSAAKSVSASDHPELAAALTKASDALDGMGSITDDIMDNIKDWVGNNGGGSIKDGLDQLSDASDKLSDAMDDLSDSLELLRTDAALTSATLAHTSVALGQMQDGLGGLTDMMGQTRDILHWLNQQDPIKVPRPSAELTNTKDSLFDAVSSINDKMNDINSTMRTASNQLTDKMRAVTAQVSVVSNLMLDAVEEISDPGSKNIFEDESENLTAQNEGKIEGCTNRGTVEADMNVGGIAGTMAVENTLDPEDDDKDENRSLLRTEYTISAVVMNCVNEGTVTSKKEAAGGICGEMDLGYITGCEAYGKVDGNNKVGGIAGHSSAKLISNWAKCELTGSKYIGGIVGQGADSVLTGNSCIIKDNRAMVEIHEPDDDGDDSEVALSTSSSNTDGQYWGAISGGQDGTFTGNLFVSDTLRGVDRISRAGQAEPIDYDTMRALEGAPKGFQKLTLTFMADGHIVDQRTFTYGASFTEADYPELPQKDGYLAEWNTPVLDDLHLDTVVTALYTSYTPALKSIDVRINGRPIFYVDGLFGGSNALSVTSQTPSGVANATEQWLLDFSDDGQETHTIRYLPQGKQGSVYVQQDGKWIKVPTDTFGSYITFTAAGTEIVMAFVPKGIPLWELCGGTVAALLVAAFLARKLIHKRKARKAKKNAAPVEELDTPIESDDQSTEQHTK